MIPQVRLLCPFNSINTMRESHHKPVVKGENMIVKTLCVLLLFFLFCSQARSQEETKEAINKLVGKNEKTWIFQRFEEYMGNKSKCISGESWTFFQDGRVVVKKCEGRSVKDEEKRWRVEQKSPIDITITVGEDEYLLIFPPPKRGSSRQSMILRLKSEIKIHSTKDLVFYYEVD